MRYMEKEKKGNIDMLKGFITGLVAIAVTLVVGFVVIGELKSSTTDQNATSAAASIATKMLTIPTWIGILIVVVMAAVVMMYFK